MSLRKTIKINPELFKVSNKKQQSSTESRKSMKQRNSLSGVKNKLLHAASASASTSASSFSKPTASIKSNSQLKDAVDFLSTIKDPNKWVDVNIDLPTESETIPTSSSSSSSSLSSSSSSSLTQPSSSMTPEHAATPPPPYGCLKQGTKPTYRNWLRSTQKNNNFHSSASTPLTTSTSSFDFKTMIENGDSKINLATMASQDEVLNQKLEKELAVIDELKKIKPEVKQKIKTKTLKKHVIGKNLKRRTITVLLKDSEKKKQVVEAKKNLKNENIDKIRDFLVKHNLLKTSSYAPNNVLLKMYENAKLTGDVYNTNISTMMNNLLIPSDS